MKGIDNKFFPIRGHFTAKIKQFLECYNSQIRQFSARNRCLFQNCRYSKQEIDGLSPNLHISYSELKCNVLN